MPPLVLFIPAIHEGYLRLIEKYQTIYILDDSLLKETSRFTYIDRDLRRIKPSDVEKLLSHLWPEKTIRVLSIENIQSSIGSVHMPEDEISEEIAEKYFKNRTTFVPLFLRWNKQITTKESEPHPGRVISEEERDTELMLEAFELSKHSSDWWRQIGAVIVKDGEVVVSAFNKRLPTDYTQDAYGDPRSNFDAGEQIELASTIHAESFAIAQAAKEGIALEGASMYVTTYPCPVCAKSIAMSGIKKLYYRDGYSLFDAEKILNAFDVEIIQVKP